MVNTLDYVKENMAFGNFLISVISNMVKALITVVPIIGAFLVIDRIFPGIAPAGKTMVIVFVVVSVLAWIGWICFLMKDADLSCTSVENWIYNPKIELEPSVLAVPVAYFVGVIVLLIIEYMGRFLEFIIALTPLSIAPAIAFGYILRKKYVSVELVWISVLYGYVFGGLLKATGIIFVVSIDVIGLPLTILAVICEVVISAFYMYIDLTNWVKTSVEDKILREERLEKEAEIDMMKEIAARCGKVQ
jgi:hypothetical protein